jgi:hypothetical protein
LTHSQHPLVHVVCMYVQQPQHRTAGTPQHQKQRHYLVQKPQYLSGSEATLWYLCRNTPWLTPWLGRRNNIWLRNRNTIWYRSRNIVSPGSRKIIWPRSRTAVWFRSRTLSGSEAAVLSGSETATLSGPSCILSGTKLGPGGLFVHHRSVERYLRLVASVDQSG